MRTPRRSAPAAPPSSAPARRPRVRHTILPGEDLVASLREAAGRGDDPGAESPADAALDGAQAQLDTLRMHVAALLHEIDEGAYRLRVVGAAVRAVARAPDLVELGEAIAMCREASGLFAGYESEAKSGDES